MKATDFTKPVSWQDFVRTKENATPGIYIWGFCPAERDGSAGKFLPYYVGKHEKNVQARIKQHVDGVRRGTHAVMNSGVLRRCMSNPAQMAKALEDEKNWVYWHGRAGAAKGGLDANARLELQPHIDFYLDNLFVQCVRLDPATADLKNRLATMEQEAKALVGTETTMGRIGKNRLEK